MNHFSRQGELFFFWGNIKKTEKRWLFSVETLVSQVKELIWIVKKGLQPRSMSTHIRVLGPRRLPAKAVAWPPHSQSERSAPKMSDDPIGCGQCARDWIEARAPGRVRVLNFF
jgi:hypothetical protein